MNMKFISVYAFMIVSIVGCRSREAVLAPPVARNTIKQAVDESPQKAIRPILRGSGLSAIIELHGQCVDASSISYALRVNTLTDGTKGTIGNLRALLAGNPGLNISKNGDDIVDISSRNLDRGLLQTRMQHVELSELAQYNPNDALLAALGTKEVRDYMNQHDISLVPQLNGLHAAPSPELPHMSPHFDNLSVEQFAIRILETFPGVVIYQECSMPNGRRLFSFEADRIAAK